MFLLGMKAHKNEITAKIERKTKRDSFKKNKENLLVNV